MRLIQNLGISVGYLRAGDRFTSVQYPEQEDLVYTVIDSDWEPTNLVECEDNEGDPCKWDFDHIVYPVESVK